MTSQGTGQISGCGWHLEGKPGVARPSAAKEAQMRGPSGAASGVSAPAFQNITGGTCHTRNSTQ